MDKVQQRRNASQGGGWCHVKLGWQLPGSTFETPKKTCILWSNSIVVTWWPSSICHFGGTFSHQNFERSECFMDTPSPFASWNPSPLELSQQFFGIKLLQVSRIVSTVSTQTWHVLCGASWLWAWPSWQLGVAGDCLLHGWECYGSKLYHCGSWISHII